MLQYWKNQLKSMGCNTSDFEKLWYSYGVAPSEWENCWSSYDEDKDRFQQWTSRMTSVNEFIRWQERIGRKCEYVPIAAAVDVMIDGKKVRCSEEDIINGLKGKFI